MHTLLLCGGSGQRLWPLSNEIRSKMFLELLPSPDGGLESMIGRVCRQLTSQGLDQTALFITHQDQIGLTKRYTKDYIQVLGEPQKKGTFHAAALGALYLYSTGKAKLNETICVAPADMFADDSFFEHFANFPHILNTSHMDITLLGTRPTFPSDQYGYIVPGNSASNEYSSVLRFQEKPSISEAQSLIKQNALWNCGVFAFSLQFMLTYLSKIGLPTSFQEFLTIYPQLPIQSFDKEVVERTAKLAVVRHVGEWRDMGSWEAMTNQLKESVTGLGGISGDSSNTHIINVLDSPLYVIGVPNIVAIASPDGILIANKQKANSIKEIIGGLGNRPIYGEMLWGNYLILDRIEITEDVTQAVYTIKLSMIANQKTLEMCSQHYSKIWTFLAGHGEILLNDVLQAVQAGDVFTIAPGVRHEIHAVTAMEWIEVRIGSGMSSEGIYSG